MLSDWDGCKQQIQGLPPHLCHPCAQPDLQVGRGLYTGWMTPAAKRTSTFQPNVCKDKQLVDMLVGGKGAKSLHCPLEWRSSIVF